MIRCDTEAEQARVRIAHVKKELAELEPKARKAEKENRSLLAEIESARKEVEAIQVSKRQ
jgi:structural maintenance of chromosome 2